MKKALATLCAAAILALQIAAVHAAPAPPRVPLISNDAVAGSTTFGLPDGSKITVGSNGMGERTDARGLHGHPVMIVRPQDRTALESRPGPSDLAIAERIAGTHARPYKAGEIFVVFRNAMSGAAIAGTLARHRAITAASTGDVRLAHTLDTMRVKSARPLFAKSSLSLPLLSQAYVLKIGARSPLDAARELRSLPSVAYASPNYYVSSFKTDPVPLPASETQRAAAVQSSIRSRMATTVSSASTGVTLPSNYGLISSMQSFLNANSVDAVDAFALLGKSYGQLPGTGERITNVSIGDLTDQSMADSGDFYVQYYGPTTVLQGGQRYLDIPSMPLIATYTADMNAQLDPTGSAEYEDPYLGEVLLDFGVMAPLPHNAQRGSNMGSGVTDLLGIAPGAQYRLVIPQQPTFANIDAALIAAATQVPRPDVITASLGYGTDGYGFPGRYLEDDPLTQEIVSAIVNQLGIVVCISSNDGTRLYTNEGVNPDGGSTATNVISAGSPTNIGDDAFSTAPTQIYDSGAIAAGGSTTDDVIAAPPAAGGVLGSQNAFAETRLDGSMDFSSGFGSRVNLSAPSDNIPSFVHYCTAYPCTAQQVVTVLEGGTSASAPEIAAAAAVVLQAGRLAGKHLTPSQVRGILEATGRTLPAAPQADRLLQVGPQIDVSAAVRSLLGNYGGPAVPRVAVAQRQIIGNVGGNFIEATDPSNIQLAGPTIRTYTTISTGSNAISPITIAPDWANIPKTAGYAISVNGKVLASTKWARLLPAQILAAAGMPLASMASRTVTLRYDAIVGKNVLASASVPLTFGPTDGTYLEAPAPIAPATIAAGQPLTVSYDVTNVRLLNGYQSNLSNPELIVSSIGHWNPINAPYFRIAYSVNLTQPKGTVTIPASVFAAGGGVYGVGILQNPAIRLVGEFAPVRVTGSSQGRPQAPTLSFGPVDTQQSHVLEVTRAQPQFSLHYDVSNVPGATGAMLEISAPGPTLGNLYNAFNNSYGTQRDNNGVDSGSTVYQPLIGTIGTASLDATKLKLPSSLIYTVRVLASNGFSVVGEASPVSTLAYYDGITPGDGYVTSFNIVPGGTSTVGTLDLDSNYNITDSSIYPYQPSTGTYLNALLDDPSGASQYYVFGSDQSLNRTGAIDFGVAPPSNFFVPPPQTLMSIDNATGKVTGTASIDPGLNEFVSAARVDDVRHRMAVLTYDFIDRNSEIFPFALDSAALAAPVTAGTSSSGRLPTTFDIDRSTGMLYLTAVGGGDNCFIFRSNKLWSLNIDTSTLTAGASAPGCSTDVASDQNGGTAYVANGSLETIGGLPGFRSGLLPVNETTLQSSAMQILPDRGAFVSGVDPVNHLLLEGFVASNDLFTNNDAMSAVDVIDLRTGQAIEHLPTFGFLYPLQTGIPFMQHGIQVDPTTRTAWTFGPFGDTVQEFNY
ncbi:MAG TPA: S8 family serine peptidase [Candidatus Baltobacteraceae bacterium]|nr:S8 family serine peptidase [Candidatus Baltobacteraceae bacterium]